ncbi:hypothetical protein FH972_024149 [Carpinus fangiana]|uniref:Uncharacterized protein n=1 Tax=Carpinus fangiana TaxID=176857 RepID=A0A5N6KXP4_9ROSI|nr:hypothetical protein FH972_024149 [Carpinus fangiana]
MSSTRKGKPSAPGLCHKVCGLGNLSYVYLTYLLYFSDDDGKISVLKDVSKSNFEYFSGMYRNPNEAKHLRVLHDTVPGQFNLYIRVFGLRSAEPRRGRRATSCAHEADST